MFCFRFAESRSKIRRTRPQSLRKSLDVAFVLNSTVRRNIENKKRSEAKEGCGSGLSEEKYREQ